MKRKQIDRLVAALVFVWAMALYLSTMAPTVSFWDPAERIASAYKLQVMHPPGAPVFLLLGRLFSMLAPSAESVAWMMNLISVLSSAGTVMLTHLIIVRLVRRWQGEPAERTIGQQAIALASGAIGALTYAATDSFWFNAGIAEVYALSTFFTALVVWLTLRWSAAARQEEEQLRGNQSHLFRLNANRYLVLIAFLFGIAIGIHLLSLLCFFFVALIVFFTDFDREEWSTGMRWGWLTLAGVVSVGLFLAIYPGLVKGLPKIFDATGAPLITAVGIAVLVAYGVYATHKRRMPRANLALMCLAVLLIGYSSYVLVPLRSATEPPVDIGDPDNIERLIDYLEREQYGRTPLLQGVTYDDEQGRVNPRGGETTLFPRRHSIDPQHWRVYDRYESDLAFFLDYQIGYMYMRYFLWNFSGRASDVQGAPAITGLPFLDPDTGSATLTRTRAGAAARAPVDARNVYFALPLLLGLFGAFYHFKRDWRRAFSVFTLFFVTGIGIVIYLNQTPMQPRERDYSYVGSFLAFSLWVGIGAGGVLQLVYESIHDTLSSTGRVAVLCGVGLLVFLAVPGWMTAENYDDHDRSGNYLPRDYAYNSLTSLEEDAILFTNGDNDTYPLWYLQEVEGVRTDVRVVNLSLLNTKWYVRQLKQDRAYESAPLPISMSDTQIQNLRPQRWKAKTVKLPVNTETLAPRWSDYLPASAADTAALESPMTWRLEGRSSGQDRRYLQTADLAAYNILRTNAENGWERPVYFALTVSSENRLNLEPYLQHEGHAHRVLPIKHDQPSGRVIAGLTDERMSQFRFTNLADSTAYYRRTARRTVSRYRTWFAYVARQLARKGHSETAGTLLDDFTESVSFSTVSGSPSTLVTMAQAYRAAGNSSRAAALMRDVEPEVFALLSTSQTQQQARYALLLARRMRSIYERAGRDEELSAFDRRLRKYVPQEMLRPRDEEPPSPNSLGSSRGESPDGS